MEFTVSTSQTSSIEVFSNSSPNLRRSHKRKTKLCALCRRSLYDRLLLSSVFFIWFCVDIVHYGIGFGLNELSGNIYTNGMLLGVADLISCVTISFIANRIGRKKSILITWGSATVGCLVYDFIRNYAVPSYLAVTVARFGSIGCFALIFLITSETFPTEVRGIIFGISNAIARFGGLGAPLISSYIYHFMLILGSMSLLSFLAALILRETLGRKMEDSVEV